MLLELELELGLQEPVVTALELLEFVAHGELGRISGDNGNGESRNCRDGTRADAIGCGHCSPRHDHSGEALVQTP